MSSNWTQEVAVTINYNNKIRHGGDRMIGWVGSGANGYDIFNTHIKI